MVGRNGIVFSGYKSHRTTEHREGGKKEEKLENKREEGKNRGGNWGKTGGNWTRKPEAKKSKAGVRKKGITERGKGRK